MATILLGAVGSMFGPVGAAIGGLIGNAFDHGVLFKPKGREGARIDNLHVQMSSYGVQAPLLFGTMRVAGTVIWATDLRETKEKHKGGKGQPSVTSYSYSASFAVALSARRVGQVKRIWADGNLLRGAAGDFKTGLTAFRLYDGGEDQPVDPLIAAAQGVGSTPAHRGMAYALFEDLALGDYGNRIPSLTFEVEADVGAVTIGAIAAEASGGQVESGIGERLEGFSAEGMDVGEALAPLVEAYGLALIDEEGGLKLRAIGASAEGVVDGGDLCARVNGVAIDQMAHDAEAADAAPVALSLRHYDAARDFQTGVQRVTRPGPGRSERGVDLPATLSSDAARGLAMRALARDWAGRATMTLRGGWPLLAHAPGALIGVEGAPGLWRVEEREWEAMAVRLALRRAPGGSSAPPAGASGGAIVRQVDAPHGVTALLLADLPQLREGVATAPLIVAAASGGEGWRGAALFLEDAGGTATPAGRTALRATMGATDMALPAGSAALIDERNSLAVTLRAPDMDLLSADAAGLAQGRNLCLVGRELAQFATARRTGPASFRLEGLRRGLYGTEWAMAGHTADEPFLLIEEERLADPLAAAGLTGEICATVRLSAIGIGDAAPAEAMLAVNGEALIPPAPAHMTATAAGGGWTIGWVRRSRAGWRWSSGGDAPLAEESERYAVRVLHGGTLTRSTEVTAPEWTYDAAMIAIDAVSGGVSIEVRQVGTRAMGRPATITLTI